MTQCAQARNVPLSVFPGLALLGRACLRAGALLLLGAHRVNDYAQHSGLASDILSALLELSANKQRLRVWASGNCNG